MPATIHDFRWDRSLIRFRVRKHRDILLPSKKISVKNFIASADNIFFNLTLDIKWWIYIAQVFIFGSSHIEVFFIINLVLYSMAATCWNLSLLWSCWDRPCKNASYYF